MAKCERCGAVEKDGVCQNYGCEGEEDVRKARLDKLAQKKLLESKLLKKRRK